MKARIKIIVLLALAATAFPFINLPAQNTLYYHPNTNSEYCIIRNYTEMVDIKYEVWPNRRFDYIDRATNMAYTFETPIDITVYDFEILEKKVYFCGGRTNGTAAVLGWFDIDSAFFYAGNIHYIQFAGLIHAENSPYIYDNITSFHNIEVANEDGVIHAYMTGQGDDAYTSPFSLFAEAWQISATSWRLDYTMCYSREVIYTDIASTEYTLIVTGLRYDNVPEQFFIQYKRSKDDSHTMSIFNMADSVSSNLISAIMRLTDSMIFTPSSAPNIVAMGMDSFAIVTWDNYRNYRSYVVSLYASPYDTTYQRFVFHGPGIGAGELSYNPSASTLGLCPDTAGYVWAIPVPCSSVTKTWTHVHHRWRNIDRVLNTKYFIVSGMTQSYTEEQLWVYDYITPNNCVRNDEVEINDISREEYTKDLLQYHYFDDFQFQDYPVKSVPSEIIIKCNDNIQKP